MKKYFFRTAGTFIRAFPQFIMFELLYKLLLMTISAPVMMLLLKLTMKLSQVSYLSDEHAIVYLRNPATITVLLLVLLFASSSCFLELSALTACFSCYSNGRKITVGDMFIAGASALKKAWKSGLAEFLKFTFIIPLGQFTLSFSVFMLPLMPMLKTAMKRMNGAFTISAYLLTQVIFVLIIISTCYSLHFLVLTDTSFKECTKKSKQLINGKKLKNAALILLRILFMFTVAAVLTFTISFFILLCIKGFASPKKAFFMSLKVLRYAWDIFCAVSSFLAGPAIICSLTGSFFAVVSPDEKLKFPAPRNNRIRPIFKAIITVFLIISGFLLNFSYIRSVYKGNINLNVGILTRTQITAHRGFSAAAPENTLYAFDAALDSGADYIELDVQQTKDGQLVVFHDTKLDRATNGTGRLNRFTYDELQKLSAAGKFADNEEFADARIPLLSEVLDDVGGNILLNIEIKDIGNSEATAEMTVDMVKEYGLENSCYITSFSYNVLKKVKSIDPSIKTGLIANSAPKAFVKLKHVDAVSMNHLLVNASVVNTAHQNGKRIFVWTVDNTEDMKNMIAFGVDNIITNHPDKATELVYSKDLGSRILTIIKALFSS